MNKQTKTISNAWEAEELLLQIMRKEDFLRKAKAEALHKAKIAVRDAQYQHYTCKVTILDNQLIEMNRKASLVAEVLAEYLDIPSYD